MPFYKINKTYMEHIDVLRYYLDLERGMDNHILVAHSCLINSLIRKVKKRKEEREREVDNY